ncbi:MAG: polymer-forming cytoskeletal protein [Candidatus Marinimicrobia bacterium]|nr:polymer-forming cytoskeletal protein [Candidatus Neomarinimicrobiota bacterium]
MAAKDRIKHVDTMIGESAVIQGDILLNGDGIIGGKVFGNVVTRSVIRITKTGYIKGDIKASDAFIGGMVQGNVTTTGKIVLQSQSKVEGDLVYHRLVIEDGAQFSGKCDLLFGETENSNTVTDVQNDDTNSEQRFTSD